MTRWRLLAAALVAVLAGLLGLQHRQSQWVAAECSGEAQAAEEACRGAPTAVDLEDGPDETGDQRALRCMAERDEVYTACVDRGGAMPPSDDAGERGAS